MADTKRTVTIFINGKEVENTYKAIQAEQKRINDELKKMEIGSDAYNRKIRELQDVNSILEEHRKKIRGVGDAFEKLGILGSLLGADAISGAISSFSEFTDRAYETYKAAEEAITKVETKMQSAGNTAGLTVEQLAAAADDIMKTTTFDDGDILNNVTNTLLNFQHIQGETFLNAQKAATDYAANTGKSLEEASTAIGQALESPEKAAKKLRAMNIILSKDEQEQITQLQKKGKLYEAQEIILGKINERYEGQAAALANTDTGKVEQLKNQWSKVEEQIGSYVAVIRGKLAPILLEAITYVAKFVGWIGAIPSLIRDNKEVLIALGVALVTFNAQTLLATANSLRLAIAEKGKTIALTASAVAQRLLNAAMTANPVGLLIKAISLLAVGFTIAYKKSETFRAVIAGIGAVAKEVFKVIQESVQSFVSGWNKLKSGDISGALKDFGKGIVKSNPIGLVFSEGKRLGAAFNKGYEDSLANEKKGKTKPKAATDTPIIPGVADLPPVTGGGKPKGKKGLTDAQKAEKAAQAQREKDLKSHLERVQKLLDDAAKRERDSSLSDLAQKENAIRDKYKKEIETAMAGGFLGQVVALEKAKNDELFLLRADALEKGADQVAKNNEELRKNALSETERELEDIKNKYQTEIDIAVQLEKDLADATEEQRDQAHRQRLQLEDQRDEELRRKKEEQHKKELEDLAKGQEEYKKELVKLSDLNLKVGDDLYKDLNTMYSNLLAMANKYGMDTVKLTEEYEKKKRELEKASNLARITATGDALGQLGKALGDFTDQQGKQSRDWVILQRLLAGVQIATNTATAISSLVAASSANPTNAVTFGAAGLAQFVAGFAQILTNIAAAKKLLTDPIPQAYDGGWRNVTGAKDGRRYRARYLGQRDTGMIPGGPGLLVNERGPEFLVSHKSLRNPAIFSHVQSIANIEGRRSVSQAYDGGFTGTGSVNTTADSNMNTSTILINVLTRLDNTLSNGIAAVLSDQTIIDQNKRLKQMDKSSSGRILGD